MRAAITRAVGERFEITDVTVAEPIDQEVLVEVRASGLCHSDITVAQNDMGVPMPIVLGHEIAGVVVAVGPSASRIKVGDHVVAAALQPCGHCTACQRGRLWSCSAPPGALDRAPGAEPRLHAGGTSLAQLQGLGGFAEQALIHENQLVAIDPAMPFEQASLIGCAVATGGGAILNVAKVQPGDSVAVFGCGGVGLNAIQVAVLAGATRVIGVDIQPGKPLATTFGATDVIDSADVNVVDAVAALTDGLGVDHAFVMVGVPAVAQSALATLGRDGTVYLVGGMSPGAELTLLPSPAESLLLPFQQGVRGSWLGSSNFYHDIPLYVDLYLRGRLNLDALVSQTIKLDEINEAYEELEGGSIARSVIVFPASA